MAHIFRVFIQQIQISLCQNQVIPIFDVTADDNFNITLVWNQPYKVIHQANSLIEKLDAGNAGNAKPEEVARIKSEALAMRGLALFDLTRLFGMPYTLDNGASLGVPIEIQITLEDLF